MEKAPSKLDFGDHKESLGLSLAVALSLSESFPCVCFSPQVQIQNKKVDISKVSSKCGSKANIKHKPGEWCLPHPRFHPCASVLFIKTPRATHTQGTAVETA